MRRHLLAAIVLVVLTVASPGLAGFAGTDLFIPMAGRGVGAYPANWFTTVYLHNPNPTAVSVDISFLERNLDNVANPAPTVTEPLAPGETRVFDNIIAALFGRSDTVYGALRIQCAEKVVASARVFSKESESAPLTQSFGQDFAATPASFAMGLGESTEILGGYTTQPYQESAARFNIGCVETTGAGSATVRWTARDGDGVQRAQYDRAVPRLSQTQGFFHDYFPGVELTNARISAGVIAGSGRVICYGSLVTNDKTFPKPVQDPTTFEMVYNEARLGAGSVQHDASLTGDGSAGAPLGIAANGVTGGHIADGAVGPAKIDATGAAAGQVLKAGAPAAWADDSLTLPYSRSASSAAGTDIFAVTNAGGGRAGHFTATSDTALWAVSTGGTGIDGRTSGAGRAGVVGIATSGTGIGVQGKGESGSTGGRFEATGGGPALVTGTGNVGVGVSDPDVKLEVNGTMRVNSDVGRLELGYPGTGDKWYFDTADGGESLRLYAQKTGGIATLRMLFDENGRVVVGNSTAAAGRLKVKHDSAVADPHLILVEDGATDYSRLTFQNQGATRFWSIAGRTRADASDDQLNFYHSVEGDLLSLSGEGIVGVRTVDPASDLHVRHREVTDFATQSGKFGMRLHNAGANGNYWNLYVQNTNANLELYFKGTLKGSFNDSNGNYLATSDERLKTDVRAMGSTLASVLALQPKRYRFAGQPGDAPETLGFLAQEVEQLFPELVTRGGDGGNDIYMVDYAGFGVVALQAIQEQQRLIEEQRRTIEQLARRVAALEGTAQRARQR